VLVEVVERKRGELKTEASWQRWDSPIRTHILPKLGKVPIAEVDARDIRDTLKPIWNEKASTAKKAMNRLGQVMTHAAALGLDVDLQAVAKARALLGRQTAVSNHIEAMDWRDVPAFYQSLGENPAELALRLLILTASRSAPVRLAHEDEVDDAVWTVPAAKMKAIPIEVEGGWRVPLSAEAQRILRLAIPIKRDGHFFVGTTVKPLSDAGMARVLDRRGIAARPHGFRSSFRDWAEVNGVRYEIAELCLGHVVGNRVERAYRRDDLFGDRQKVLAQWANFLTAKLESTSDGDAPESLTPGKAYV
jgi:integrase